jgi:hypothetical protein
MSRKIEDEKMSFCVVRSGPGEIFMGDCEGGVIDVDAFAISRDQV